MAKKQFVRGEQVVLAEGTYQGTCGVFLQLRPDIRWADIEERNGAIRSHPMQWLQHATRLAPLKTHELLSHQGAAWSS
jgi:hypothetical protein